MPTFKELVSSGSVAWGYFIKLDWPSGTVYAHSRLGDISFDGQIYKGLGYLGSVESIQADSRISPKNSAITLTGIRGDLLGEVTKVYCRGRSATIHFCVLDENEQVIGSKLLFDGYIDKPTITRGSQNTVRLELVSKLNDWNKTGSGRFNDESQRAKHPDDHAYRYVAQLVGRPIAWGDKFNPEPLRRT